MVDALRKSDSQEGVCPLATLVVGPCPLTMSPGRPFETGTPDIVLEYIALSEARALLPRVVKMRPIKSSLRITNIWRMVRIRLPKDHGPRAAQFGRILSFICVAHVLSDKSG